MIFTPKGLRQAQAKLLQGNVLNKNGSAVSRIELTDEKEPSLTAVIGKRSITLYSKATRGKRIQLGKLGESDMDDRKWVSKMREQAFQNRIAIKNAKRENRAILSNSTLVTPGELPLTDYLDEYYYKGIFNSRKTKPQKNSKSQKAMRSHFGSFMHKKLVEVTLQDFDHWKENYGKPVIDSFAGTLTKPGVKDVTKERYFKPLDAVFNFAVRCGHIPRNPFLDQEGNKPTFIDDKEDAGRPLTREELERLKVILESRHIRDRVFCLMSLATGARPCELMGISLNDIDFSRKRILLRAAFTKTKKTRYLQISDKTADMLRDYIEVENVDSILYNSERWLFRNYRKGPNYGQRMKEFRRPWNSIKSAAMIDNRLYDLRHTFAKEIYTQKKDIVITSRALGHSSIKTTENYLSTIGVNLTEEILNLDSLLY